ncbi:hypothetical protein [Zavarzinia sp.]|uniref:hypothetical protein n=1 Tax=Zavarzinia sp. TaxID=2027920 RepID=UPI003564404C
MATAMPSGWTSHVQTLLDLRSSVELLADGSKSFNQKMQTITLMLVRWRASDVPLALRPKIERVHEARRQAMEQLRHAEIWHFDDIRGKARKQLIADIIDLYSACLLDVHKLGPEYAFLYPSEE